jgi:F0F1-type ATP synthase membrane subunit b/b'
MDTKLKLELLAKEYNATMAHAEEVLSEYIATAIEEAVMNAIDKLDDNQKMLLLIALLED